MSNGKILTPYETVQEARNPKRAGIFDYIEALFEDFVELHGDRLYRDDPSLVGGIASFCDMTVMVIGHRKGKNTKENIAYNFGMTSPEGYRKAIRLMKMAEKFGWPVITFVDTPGAYPGLEAESNGQSNAIAESIACMCGLKTPVISIVTGEGNSGGALAIAAADRVWMLEHAIYAILSPEGFASIMWKDASKAAEACEAMKITARELKDYGLVDDIIPEGENGLRILEEKLLSAIKQLKKYSPEELAENRYRKFRTLDSFLSQLESNVSETGGDKR